MAKLYQSGIVITGDARQGLRVLRVTQDELKRVKSALSDSNVASRRFTTGMRGMHGSMTSLHGIVRQLAPAMSALSAGFVAREIVQAGLAMDGYERSLRAVLGSAEASARELEFVRQEAERVGVEFQPLVREYAKLAAAARQTQLEGQGVRDVFTSIIEVSRVLNLSTEDTRGAIFALQQMLSKGKISAEELRRQLGERIPGSMHAMARAVGVSVEQLDGMLKRGELLSEEVMPAFAAELQKMAEGGLAFAAASPAAEFARLQNALFDLNVEASKDLLPLLADGARSLIPVLQTIAPHLKTIITLMAGFAIARVAGGHLNLLGRQARETAQMIRAFGVAETFAARNGFTLATAAKAARGALALLGGPGGAAIMAATGIYALKTSQNAAAEEAAAFNEQLWEQISALDELDRRALESLIEEDAPERFDTLTSEYEALQEELKKYQTLAEGIWTEGTGIDEAIASLTHSIHLNRLEYNELEEAVANAGVRMSKFGSETDPAAEAANKLQREVQGLVEGLNKKTHSLGNTRDALIQEAQQLLKNKDLTAEQRQELEGAVDALQSALAAQKAKNAADKEAERLTKSATKTWQEFLKAIDPVVAAEIEYNAQAEALIANQHLLEDSGYDLAEVLEWLRLSYDELTTAEERLEAANKQLIEDAREYLTELERENAALQIAIEQNIDLATAKLILAGAEQDLIDATQAAIAENQRLNEQYTEGEKKAKAYAKTVERSVERMDDAFKDFWGTLLRDGKFTMDSLKDLVIDTVAEMIHALTTRRFVAAIAGSLNAGGALANQGGGLGGGLDITSLFGGGGGGGFSSLGSLFGGFGSGSTNFGLGGFLGGNSIGTFLENMPTWFGGVNTTTGTGLFAGAGQVSNGLGLGAGLLGGLAGHLISPDSQASLGGSLGASLGSYIGAGASVGGPWGAVIGAAIGILAGSFFKSRDPETTIGGRGYPGGNGDHQALTGAFGDIVSIHARGGVGGFLEEGTTGEQLGQAILQFDQVMYDLLSSVTGEEQINEIKEALDQWGGTWEEGAITVENILGDRFDAILSTFEGDVVAFVGAVETLEEKADRLGIALTAKSITESLDALGDHTWQEFVVVAQAMQQEGEDLNSAFSRLVQTIQVLSAAGEVLSGYANSNLADDYMALIESQQQTVFDAGRAASAALREAMDNFDGSAEAALNLSVMAQRRYELELQMLAAIDSYALELNASYNNLIEQIQTDLRTPEENYAFFSQQAENLAASLPGLRDPAQIAQVLAEIERLTSQAYGFLTDEQRAALGPEVVDFLQEVQEQGNRALEQARQDVLNDAKHLREEIGYMMDEISDPLLRVADQLGFSADELRAAAEALSAAGQGLGALPGIINAGIQAGVLDGGGPGGDATGSDAHNIHAVSVPIPAGGISTVGSGAASAAANNQVINQMSATIQHVAGSVRHSNHANTQAIQHVAAAVQHLGRQMARSLGSREVGGAL